MKKKIAAIAFIVILIAAVCIIIVVRHKTAPDTSENTKSYSSMEEVASAADFDLQYSDRLCGYPATGFEANGSTIEVEYGEAGYLRKTYAVVQNSDRDVQYEESSEQEINGMKITFKGRNEKIFLAEWNNNNFAYTIALNEETGGVDSEEMSEYIIATR
ncbi:MAG: hypothetical protein IKS28_08320, partial [Clostridia bacterium]|nr:hypothetical protein [Clostridia bacterium]